MRVFILDDHSSIREAFRFFLDAQEDVEVVGEASTAREALNRSAEILPDVALLDVRIPDGNGVEVCREIRSRHPEVRCLIVTGYPEEEALSQALLAGAAGYLEKTAGLQDLLAGVRRVAAGRSLLDPARAEVLLQRLRREAHGDDAGALSDQQKRILDLIGAGRSNREIADELHLAEQTVKNYVSKLLKKLGLQRRTQAAVYATQLRQAEDGA